MAAVYPSGIKSFGAVVDAVDVVFAAHINDLRDEVEAVEGELGTGLKTSTWTGAFAQSGSWGNLALRLTNIERGIVTTSDVHTQYVKKAGDAMTGSLTMGGQVIGNLGNGSAATDAVNYGQVLLRSGANAATGNLNMGTSYKITNLADGSAATDAATKGQVDTVATAAAAAQTTANNALPKAGGTMTGKITLDGDPSSALHAATKQYADLMLPKAGGTMSGAIAMGSQKITGLQDGTSSGDAVNKGQLDAAVLTKYCIGLRTSSASPGSPGYNVTYQSETDPYSMLNAGTGTVTIPDTGVWMVTGFTEFLSLDVPIYPPLTVSYTTAIVINDVAESHQSAETLVENADRANSVSGLFSFTAGATVKLNMSVSNGNVVCSQARFSVHRVA